MLEAVVAKMVAERPFGLELAGMDFAENAEIRVGANWQRPAFLLREADAPSAQGASEGQLGHALGQGHHGCDGKRGRPADVDVHGQRLSTFERGGVVDADAAMELVVQPDFAILFVAAA